MFKKNILLVFYLIWNVIKENWWFCKKVILSDGLKLGVKFLR